MTDAAPKRIGRPPEPVPHDIAERILDWLAEGNALDDLLGQPGMPSWSTVSRWKRKDAEFKAAFVCAREDGASRHFDESLRVARKPLVGETVTTEGEGNDAKVTVKREDMLGHRRLLIDTLQKHAACFCPSVFGQKAQLEHSGKLTLDQVIAQTIAAPGAESAPQGEAT